MSGPKNRRVLVVGLIVSLLVAVGVSQFASSEPDGLEFVAEQEGISDAAQSSPTDASPLAGYGDSPLGRALAGLVGVLVTLGIGWAVFWLARRSSQRTDDHQHQG